MYIFHRPVNLLNSHRLQLVNVFGTFMFPTEHVRVSVVRGALEDICCEPDVPVSGGSLSPAGSTSHLHGADGRTQTDMEVGTR